MFDDTVEDASYYNNAFVERIKEEGPEKAAAAMTDYVRMKIREVAFCRPILGSQPITPLELDKSEKSDTPVKWIDVEPDSEGYAVTFKGKAPEKWFKQNAAMVAFANYQSEEFKCTLAQLATYRMPVKQIVHDNHLLDVAKKEDDIFIKSVDTILGVTGKVYNASGGFIATELTKACKQITKDELKVGTILINESSFQDILSWPATQVGDVQASEVHINGFTYSKLLGHNFVRTTKVGLVPDGNIYIFAGPQYLGRHYVLHDVQTFLEQKGPNISFYCWEDVGMAIANTKAVAKMTWTP